ncbi:MAG: nucleotidyltransferase domain-containing protein [Dehalococcoidia bacterium]
MSKVHTRLGGTPEQIEQFCRKWKIVRLELFGSVLRDDFDDESDIDLLVTFDEDHRPSLGEQLDMEDELRTIFGRNVDLVKRHLVETSENWIRRRRILESARPIYAAT